MTSLAVFNLSVCVWLVFLWLGGGGGGGGAANIGILMS